MKFGIDDYFEIGTDVLYLFHVFIFKEQYIRIVSLLPPSKDMIQPRVVSNYSII